MPSEQNIDLQPLRITLLGVPQFVVGDETISGWPSRAAEAIIAYVVSAETPVPRGKLVDLLWPESAPKQAQANLRSILTKIRKSLGDYINIERHMVGVFPDAPLWVDSAELSNRLTSSATLTDLSEAVELYRGELLAGLELRSAYPFNEWLAVERERLERLIINALTRLSTSHLNNGTYDKGEAYARRWTSLDPFSEHAVQTLMKLQLRLGRRNEALHQYASFRTFLNEELGVEPLDETQALAEVVRSATQIGATNLRPARATFVGRTSELETLAQLIHRPESRLTTVLGMGGMGKTRLAHALGRTLAPGTFLDGIWFVELAAAESADSLMREIARAIGMPTDGRTPLRQQLLTFLRGQECLLILDNFEQLTSEQACSAFVAELLSECPRIKLLVTSRERLNLYEERVVDLLGLPVDEGVDLFMQHAQRQLPGFAADAEALAHLITLLDGVPLALELAAGWLRQHDLPTITQTIQKNIDYLATHFHNVPARHRSLRAVFETSWVRLSESEQRTFAALTIFRGGFTAVAAHAVADCSPAVLRQLCNKSLLIRHDEGWFQIHELLRQLAAEHVSAEIVLKQKHSTYFLNLLETNERIHLESGRDLISADCDGTLDHLPNIRSAWEWAVNAENITSLKPAILPLMRDAQFRGWLHVGVRLLQLADALTSDDSTWLGRIQLALGFCQRFLFNFDEAISHLEHALTLLPINAAEDRARTRLWLAMCYVYTNRSGEARATIGEAAENFHDLGLEEMEALAYNHEYHVHGLTDGPRTGPALESALALKNYPRYHAEIIKHSGSRMIARGRYEEAIARYKEARDIALKLGDRMTVGTSIANMALANAYLGNLEETIALNDEALPFYYHHNRQQWRAGMQNAVASAALRVGNYKLASQMFEASAETYTALSQHLMIANMRAHLAMAELRLGLPQAKQTFVNAFNQVYETGNMMTMSAGLPSFADCVVSLGEPALGKRLAQSALNYERTAACEKQIARWVLGEDEPPTNTFTLEEAYQVLQSWIATSDIFQASSKRP